jgi:hypothetical protein
VAKSFFCKKPKNKNSWNLAIFPVKWEYYNRIFYLNSYIYLILAKKLAQEKKKKRPVGPE